MVRRLSGLLRGLVWGSIGAIGAYFGDPDRGRSRRTRARDQLGGAVRRQGQRAQRGSRHLQATFEGRLGRVMHARVKAPADDRALVDRIKSQILSSPPFAELDVLVEAVNGVVSLRGEIEDALSRDELERAVAFMPGVVEVHSLVHPPGTPAPNKQASLAALSH